MTYPPPPQGAASRRSYIIQEGGGAEAEQGEGRRARGPGPRGSGVAVDRGKVGRAGSQGGDDGTGAPQGGADRAEDLHGGTDGPEDHGRDWDLGNTETHETDRASMAENTKKSSINSGLIIGGFKGSKPASLAVTRQGESSQTAFLAVTG